MEFKAWTQTEIEKLTSRLDADKSALKQYKVDLKEAKKAKEDTSQLEIAIKRLESSIHHFKFDMATMKRIQKLEVVRLKTGKVISLSTLKAFSKKVSSRMWSTEITQHPDGLKMTYTDGTAKGQITVTGFGVDAEIPDEVEIPVYAEGEVLECLIHS